MARLEQLRPSLLTVVADPHWSLKCLDFHNEPRVDKDIHSCAVHFEEPVSLPFVKLQQSPYLLGSLGLSHGHIQVIHHGPEVVLYLKPLPSISDKGLTPFVHIPVWHLLFFLA